MYPQVSTTRCLTEFYSINESFFPFFHLKESLAKYAKAYPEFLQVLCIYLADNGQAHVGLGRYKNMKLKNLYDSQDQRKIRYY